MSEYDDIRLSEEEMSLARKGEALIKAEVASVQAPQALRERIEAERERAARRAQAPFWRRHRFALGAVGATAVALVAVVVALQSGGGSGEPTYASVDATAALSPTDPAPAAIGGDPPVLDASVGAIEFPDWEDKFGLRAVGSREDEVSGRSVTTVVYRNEDGAELGYAIVDGEPLAGTPNGEKVMHEGKTYHVASDAGGTVVTWTQQGHTCVLFTDAGLAQAKLVELAASRNV
jgi:hypothetical protein